MGNIDRILTKNKHTFGDFVEIIRILRSPNGCPWDKEQTHKSIRKNFIEETYEVLEAIDNDDKELLKEELGDVLLQILLHSQMEEEDGVFSIDDVIDGVCKKMIYRHPHVFGDVYADTSEKVLSNWDKLKKVEKNQKSETEILKSVPAGLPSLMRATKVQHKASKAGFDWNDYNGALDKLYEETDELKAAIEAKDKQNQLEELGDLLFSVVNISRFIGVDAEEALTWSTNKFIKRFEKVEQLSIKSGKKMNEMTLKELDELWNKVK